MKRSRDRRLSRSSSRRFRICAPTETSRDGDRLVADEQLRLGRQRPRDRHPLSLSARELAREDASPLRERARRRRAAPRSARGDRPAGEPLDAHRLGDLIPDRHPGIQGALRVLEDDLDVGGAGAAARRRAGPASPRRRGGCGPTSAPRGGASIRPVVLFPLPDSPTRPRVSPRRISKEIPSTALTRRRSSPKQAPTQPGTPCAGLPTRRSGEPPGPEESGSGAVTSVRRSGGHRRGAAVEKAPGPVPSASHEERDGAFAWIEAVRATRREGAARGRTRREVGHGARRSPRRAPRAGVGGEQGQRTQQAARVRVSRSAERLRVGRPSSTIRPA